MSESNTSIEEFLPGGQWRINHFASVRAILGDSSIPVYSYGDTFMNINFWPLNHIITSLCKWAHDNPGATPSRDQISEWVKFANQQEHFKDKARIVMPAMPAKITSHVYTSYIGGAYHEAAHSLYSENNVLQEDEIIDLILPRWALVDNWSPYAKLLLTLANIIEDIRIERMLIAEFPGTETKMWDLQDFILMKEGQSDSMCLENNPDWIPGMIGIAKRGFRDAGLGYGTQYQRAKFEWYKTVQPDIMEMLLKGPLLPVLKEAIPDVGDGLEASKKDTKACLRLSLDFIGVIDDLVQKFKVTIPEHPPCPSCGASPKNLVVYPHPDKKGWVKKKCSKCGYEEEAEIPPVNPIPDHVMIEFDVEGEQPTYLKPRPSGGGGSKSDGDSEESSASGGTGEPGDAKDSESEDGKASEGEGESEDGKASEGEGESEDGKDPASGDLKDVPRGTDLDKGDSDAKGSGPGAGGFKSAGENPESGIDFPKLAAELLGEAAENRNSTPTLDHSSALTDEIEQVREKENRHLHEGERPYAPFYTDGDTAEMVKPSPQGKGKYQKGGKGQDRKNAEFLLKGVRSEVAYLRARMRNMFRDLEQRGRIHGVRKGKRLSGRTLTDTYISIKAGKEPRRAFTHVDRQVDISIAAAVVIDQSYSMARILTEASKILIAITEPLDHIGAKVQVSGIRDGYGNQPPEYPNNSGPWGSHALYHRIMPVHHDVFKRFDEKFTEVKWRFSRTIAEGGTPLSDGVQYGLNALNSRQESSRLLFVITDGVPNQPHEQVIASQCRIAKQAGIHVVGVGIGSGSVYVKKVFPDHVHANQVKDLPRLLVKKLNQLIEKTGKQVRGKRMKA